MIERLLIVGVGLIGASAGLAARERGLARRVVGFSRHRETLEAARKVGAIDEYETDLARAARGADFVLIATPVGAIASRAIEVARMELAPGAPITDAGSVKAAILNALESDPATAARFVGGHPIAGTEKSGPRAAKAGLFEGRSCILTPTSRTDPALLERVRAFWEGLGMEVQALPPGQHDEILAMISHLPHLVAYALVGAVSHYDRSEHPALAFTAGGFKDFTRIAASSPEMWRAVAAANQSALLAALDRFGASFDEIRRALTEARFDDLEALFDKAARVRRSLTGRSEEEDDAS